MKTRLFLAVLVGGFTVFSGCATPGDPSKRCWLFFETTSSTATPKAEAPKPVATPAPAAVTLRLTPVQASLRSSQSQAFSADVSGTSNTGVNWAIDPLLGMISPAGVYTAPAQVALAERVKVTATSQADPSKSASSWVQLNPPASAAKQVSIELNVLFDTGKDVVKPDYNNEIKNVADFMKSYPGARAEIEGHTDSMGLAAMNVDLSQRRANSVRQVLIQKFGVDASRLSAKGYGASKPIAENKTAEGRAKNRRVVATLTSSSN